jgi:hypothetical protein
MKQYLKIYSDPNSSCGVVEMAPEHKNIPELNQLNFLAGEKITTKLPNPLKFIGSVYKPYPIRPSHILEGVGILLVSDDFVTILRNAGVDNIELFPASIEFPKLKKTWTDYYALNVLDLVDILNKEKSSIRTILEGIPGKTKGMHIIEKMVLDAKKLSKKDFKIFRIVQDPLCLIIIQDIITAFIRNLPKDVTGKLEDFEPVKRLELWGIDFDKISVE